MHLTETTTEIQKTSVLLLRPESSRPGLNLDLSFETKALNLKTMTNPETVSLKINTSTCI